MSLKRVLLAFVLSPLATPMLFAVLWLLFGTLDFEQMWITLLLIGVFAYVSALLFGVPLVIATRRLKRQDKAIFITTGALAGLLVSIILRFGFGWFEGFLFHLICCIAGSLSSFTFWLIAFVKKAEAVELSPSN